MQTSTLGRTGLTISRLGVGLAEIGYELTLDEEATASQVLNTALDSGISFLDTAACYGISEELIGRTVSHRRDEYVLATKCGHVAGDMKDAGYEPWTAKTVTASIDRSLRRLQTDHLDLVQLHSCGVDVLEKGDVIKALLAAQSAGKTRFVGYSGDNDSAMWAVQSDLFDTLQTSFNLVEQKARFGLFDAARERNMGIIVKRPIANGSWGANQSPRAYADQYWQRAATMKQALPDFPYDRILLALGFTLAHDAVDVAIVGTHNPAHMQSNIRKVEDDLPIDDATVAALHARFAEIGMDWPQLS